MTKVRDFTKDDEDYIKDNLRYDSDTGDLWWIKRNKGRCFDKPVGTFDKITGYVRVGCTSGGVFRSYLAHRLAWFLYHGDWPKEDIDHINNIRDDNRIVNLREATRRENHGNRKVLEGGSSKYKGVSWYKRYCNWIAKIKINYKQIHLGYYTTEEEAALAYNKAALEHFGEYAKINDVTP